MDIQSPINLSAIAEHPDFRLLSKARNRLGVGLAVAMAAIYFTFISLVAFSPATLAIPISDGSALSIGIIVGVAIMASGFILTAVYVVYSSTRLDALVDVVKRSSR